MGSTPVPNLIRSVACAYAASQSAASRASGSCETHAESKPSLSATFVRAMDSSRVLTAELKTARRVIRQRIYSDDLRSGALYGTAAGRQRALSCVFAGTRGARA